MYNSAGITKTRDANKVLAQKRPVSILMLGTDTGALGRNYKGRTDTMMIMTLNPQKKTTTIVSLPRDMKVNLPDYPDDSPAKINAAYTYGGVKESVKTVQKHFNIPIDYYVLVNMGGLEKAINQVGGVDVKSPLTFDYEGAHFTKGQTYHLNGNNALKFSRMRYDDPQGDYGRQQRQRLVITALLKKSVSYKTVLNQRFLRTISDSSQTDLTFNNMVTLAKDYRGSNANIVQDHAQGHGVDEDGQDYEVVPTSEQQRITDLLQNSLKN
jgi:LCP family protein required for cell wall assembly